MNSQVNSNKKIRDPSINSNGNRPSSVSSAGGGRGSGRSLAETSTTILTYGGGISLTDIWIIYNINRYLLYI